MIPYSGQLKTYPFTIDRHRRHHKQKDGSNPTIKYCESILTFDIEVSSAWLENGEVIGYRKGESAEYWNSLEPLALPYIWQFSCDGKVYYGRELVDFEKVLEDIPSDLNCIIWVHNLSYEFAFLSNFLEWDSVFARSSHKPMKCVPSKYKNIEFRCSYYLTRLSLADWGKQIGLPKMVGDLDYETLRTPLTELSEIELGYCERDCLVVEAGIKDYVKRYNKQRNIPLTQTGTVRKVVKDKLMADPNYVKYIKRLVPHNADEYAMLRDIFAGGYTHANRFYSAEVITGIIEHYDFASSYPTVMVAEKFPCTPWVYIGDELPSEDTFKDTAYIFKLKFSQLNCITFNTYIQASKCKGKGIRYDNGRVIHADILEITITEQDYLTIKETYKWEDLEVLEVYRSYKDYLPRDFVEYILELYANKTELKDVEGFEDLYMQSKQYINSLFGMSVTAIVQANVEYKDGEWITEILTKELVDKKLKSLKIYNPRDKRYFLSYSWGCYVTAYARRNLWICMQHINEDGSSNDHDTIYCDTDSIFILGKHNFDWYNKEITNKIKKACKEQNLDVNKTAPKTPKGIAKPLGIFTKEDDCSEFITLGAKRYVERRINDGKLHLTVSGINKGAVELLNDKIENFEDGFEFDKDADCVSKRLCTYCLDMPITVWEDGYVSNYKQGINLRRTGYKLTVSAEYKALLELGDLTIDDLTEQTLIDMRGEWYD